MIIRAVLRLRALALAVILGAAPALASEAIKPLSSAAAEASHVFCAATCFLRSLYVTTGATAGYLMVFNATSAPADGAVTPVECAQVAANTTLAMDFGERAEPFPTGLTAVFSTTGCFTKTASATAFFKALTQ